MAQKKYLILGGLVLAILLVATYVGYLKKESPNSKVYEGEAIIIMKEDDYYPSEITVKTGTKVIFKNESEYGTWPASDLHPSHGIYSEFDSKGVVKPGDSWSFQFDKPGTWGMHDHLAPYIVGKVTVVE